jgi:hypothetical protein
MSCWLLVTSPTSLNVGTLGVVVKVPVPPSPSEPVIDEDRVRQSHALSPPRLTGVEYEMIASLPISVGPSPYSPRMRPHAVDCRRSPM